MLIKPIFEISRVDEIKDFHYTGHIRRITCTRNFGHWGKFIFPFSCRWVFQNFCSLGLDLNLLINTSALQLALLAPGTWHLRWECSKNNNRTAFSYLGKIYHRYVHNSNSFLDRISHLRMRWKDLGRNNSMSSAASFSKICPMLLPRVVGWYTYSSDSPENAIDNRVCNLRPHWSEFPTVVNISLMLVNILLSCCTVNAGQTPGNRIVGFVHKWANKWYRHGRIR